MIYLNSMYTTYFNIKELLTLSNVKNKDGKFIKKEDLSILNNAYIITKNDEIIEVGTGKHQSSDINIDLKKQIVMPCFIDSHTHITFDGNRSSEMEMRSEGKTYIEIAEKGGGILSTVQNTRKASLNKLINTSKKNIKRLNKFGVGVIEAKSGYGLNFESEIKQLKAIKELNNPLIIPTLLAAHDIPPKKNKKDKRTKEERKKEYIEEIVKNILPEVSKNKLAKFFDVFLEEGYYTPSETRFLINEAKKYGLIPKLHADEFTNQEGASLAVELGAASVDHLQHISNNGIDALANSKTVATLLPGTSFNLGLKYPPARKLIDSGASIAIGSDFNPGSNPSLNFQLMLVIAITQMKMTLAEAIAAGTYNGAKSLLLHDKYGVIEKGYKLAIQTYKLNSYQEIFYNYGENFLNKLIIS